MKGMPTGLEFASTNKTSSRAIIITRLSVLTLKATVCGIARRNDNNAMSYLEPSGSNSGIQPLPSLPPSPTEEDLSGASAWHEVKDEDERLDGHRLSNGSVKGKERAREVSLDEDEDGAELTPTTTSGYPPLKDEEEESRRIEQVRLPDNLTVGEQ